MKTSSSVHFTFGVSAAIVVLVGCGGVSPSPLAPSGSIAQSAVQPTLAGTTGVFSPTRDHRRSWMSPEARRKDLLYLGDQIGDVYVYTYPKGKLVGTLTGLPDPQGECVDKKGDVFVTNFGNGSEILAYKHGATAPYETLVDTGWYIEGCSVDPMTGNLAVVNFAPISGTGNGGVSIFAKAQGSPTVYQDPNLLLGYQLGYDNQGNIFLDGVDSSRNFEFAELPKGSSTFTTIPLNVTINTPGGVQWDGKYVTVGDAKGSVIYQTNGAGGQVVGSTQLTGSNGVFQFFIDGKTVVGPNAFGASTMFWSYPSGGSPTKTLTGMTDPFGAAVSKRKK